MIINRYIGHEILKATLGITFLVVFIFAMNQLIRYLSALAYGKLFGAILGQIMLVQIPYLTGLLLPLGLFLGALFALSRLSSDRELLASMSFGYSQKRLLALCFQWAAWIAVIVAILNFWVNPLFLKAQEVMIQKAKSASLLQAIAPGRFLAFSGGKSVAYVAEMDRSGEHFKHVFLAVQSDRKKENQWDINVAKEGYSSEDSKTGQKFLVTNHGARYTGIPGESNFRVMTYEQYGLLSEDSALPIQLKYEERGLPIQKLLPHLHKPEFMAEFQWRISLPLSIFVLMLYVIPLSQSNPRSGRYLSVLPGVFLYVIYANLLLAMRHAIAHHPLSLSLNMLWIHLPLALLGGFLWCKSSGYWDQWRLRWRKAHAAG